MSEPTVGDSIGKMQKVFVTCSGCGVRDQIAPYRLIVYSTRTWRAVFPQMRCRERPNACGAHAARLEVFGGAPSSPRLVLELKR